MTRVIDEKLTWRYWISADLLRHEAEGVDYDFMVCLQDNMSFAVLKLKGGCVGYPTLCSPDGIILVPG
jgi:hypothetical protein